ITRICKEMNYDMASIVYDSTIYRCPSDNILAAIHKIDESVKTVLVVGHNPATTDVANMLQQGEQWTEVPTCGVVAIAFEGVSWNEIGEKRKGKLLFFSDPDKL
ncbi:MAG TPA: hypothetical protein VD905_16455, partial [Flavobacteriales bacterium]|nr:hypothetical protein [Flavobacteriales bacterium]